MTSPPRAEGQPHRQARAGTSLSPEGIRRLQETMAGYVQRGEVPGLTSLVARGQEVSGDAFGSRAVGAADRLVQRNTLFRIASMTKAITAAATMMLVEDWKLKLDEPIDTFLPELANRKVLRKFDSPLDDTVPAKRAITVRDLLTFRWGLGLLLADPTKHPIVRELYARHVGVTPWPKDMTLGPDEWMRALGTVPLIHQPGEGWLYSTGSDVLGVLIARRSKQSFETFLNERLFDPLGMRDTSFSVPTTKLDRFGACYAINSQTKKLEQSDAADGQWSKPPVFPAGGSGLTSTVDDYFEFAKMLLNRGISNKKRKRVLSEDSVAQMTSNQITPEQAAMGRPILGEKNGWGFGMAVLMAPDQLSKTAGRYGWNGGLGSSWWNDPTNGLTAIVMTSRNFEAADPPAVIKDFWRGAYQALPIEGQV